MGELDEIRQKRMRELIGRQKNKNSGEIIDKPIVLTDATFNEAVGKHPLFVVDCWAPWCGPCQMIGPIIEELARDYAGKIVFGKLNVDENRQTSSAYGIQSIPALLVFKNGKHVDTIVGALPRQVLEPKITQHIA